MNSDTPESGHCFDTLRTAVEASPGRIQSPAVGRFRMFLGTEEVSVVPVCSVSESAALVELLVVQVLVLRKHTLKQHPCQSDDIRISTK